MRLSRERQLFEIFDPVGHPLIRFETSRRAIGAVAMTFALAFAASAALNVWAVRSALARAGAERSAAVEQRARLRTIDAKAAALGDELQRLERENAEIGKRFGSARSETVERGRQSYRSDDDFASVAARIERLRAQSVRVRADGERVRGLALRVLNVRRFEELARARALAEIPSLNPAGDVGIRSPFGWRMDPWPEFHAGVDLAADYGDRVVAAAAGIVTFAAYDGDFGNRVEIDHGNGYRTWYCHLSRIDVTAGERVRKAQRIALVGSTGESTGPHLHYQVMLDGKAVDPAPYLSGVPAKVLVSLR